MSGNYPPGVTGNEPEIAGPMYEEWEEYYCDHCEEDTQHEVTEYCGEGVRYWVCDECGTQFETQSPDPFDDPRL